MVLKGVSFSGAGAARLRTGTAGAAGGTLTFVGHIHLLWLPILNVTQRNKLSS